MKAPIVKTQKLDAKEERPNTNDKDFRRCINTFSIIDAPLVSGWMNVSEIIGCCSMVKDVNSLDSLFLHRAGAIFI